MNQEIRSAIEDADMVLVGLGEEFDNAGVYKRENQYIMCKKLLEENHLKWLLPVYDSMARDKQIQSILEAGLNNLSNVLTEKNYFIVSTTLNPAVTQTAWKEGRLVTPCGSIGEKQCLEECEEGLQRLSEQNMKSLTDYFDRLQAVYNTDEAGMTELLEQPELGVCSKCGKPLILNNIYAEHYDEKGYLLQWQVYTKWLQGTLNKKLVILELGVGMMFPSVIRWPFEKVAFFNNKAHLYRVNEKLYQLSEDLKGKGTAISKNSIDWLHSL